MTRQVTLAFDYDKFTSDTGTLTWVNVSCEGQAVTSFCQSNDVEWDIKETVLRHVKIALLKD